MSTPSVEWQRNRRAQWKEQGLCSQCGRTPVCGMKTCERCQDKDRKHRQTPDAKRKRKELDHAAYVRNRDIRLQQGIAINWQRKRQVIVAYGGRCACCGEDGLQFLAIDHINGDGAAHRRQVPQHLYPLFGQKQLS